LAPSASGWPGDNCRSRRLSLGILATWTPRQAATCRDRQRRGFDAMSTLEKHYTLRQAVRTFFPDGPITVSTLRTAIKKRKLQATMPEGKLLVTEAWLAEWLNRCRVAVDLLDYGSSPPSAVDPLCGSSSTDRNTRALDAASATLKRLSASSPNTSAASMRPRRGKASNF
jgi:hypothetical protein